MEPPIAMGRMRRRLRILEISFAIFALFCVLGFLLVYVELQKLHGVMKSTGTDGKVGVNGPWAEALAQQATANEESFNPHSDDVPKSAMSTATLQRSRRGAKGQRTCVRCCRDCECSDEVKGPSDIKQRCERCCKKCTKTCDKDKFTNQVSNMFRSRLGHFVAKPTHGVKGCKGNVFEAKDHQIPQQITTTGYICSWQYADWMTPEAKDLYDLHQNGKVKVKQGGVYYIYGQLVFHQNLSTSIEGIMVKESHGTRELSRCMESSGSLLGQGGVIRGNTYRTCHTGALTQLDNGAYVYLKVYVSEKIGQTLIYESPTAYFGLIKFA